MGMKAIIVPGNGNTDISENWYQSVKTDIEGLGIEVIAENMPDPDLARKEYWLPFIANHLATENSILIGHSSGAVATLRYLESNKCKLAILVGASVTDLGSEHEKKSGYFDDPWQWDSIKNNAEKIILFASKNDPYIPIEEALVIREKLSPEYHEYTDEGHFGADVNKTEFPEIKILVEKFIKSQKAN
jgi:uncharacterized protein